MFKLLILQQNYNFLLTRQSPTNSILDPSTQHVLLPFIDLCHFFLEVVQLLHAVNLFCDDAFVGLPRIVYVCPILPLDQILNLGLWLLSIAFHVLPVSLGRLSVQRHAAICRTNDIVHGCLVTCVCESE